MTFTIPQDWTVSGARDDLRVTTEPTEGAWLIATLAYRVTDGTSPLASVADMAGNWWVMVGAAENVTVRVEVWACPAVAFRGFPMTSVYAAVSHIHADDVGSVVLNVAEVAGFVNGFPTVVSATVGTAFGTSLSIDLPDPAGRQVFVLAAGAANDGTVVVTPPGTGWGTLTGVARTGPGIRLAPAWTSVSAPITATWTTPTSVGWTGVVVALAKTGDEWPQPSVGWPATRLQLGAGYGLDTPLPRITDWVDVTDRFESLTASRGPAYELGQPQAGEGTVNVRNYDGALTPVSGGDYDLYTPYQLLMAWDGKVHAVASGWVEEWRRRWDTSDREVLGGEGIDALANLAQEVPTALRGEVLRHAPWGYWPLADQSGSPAALDIAGRGAPPLAVTASKYGVADASASFGAQTDIEGDGGSGWEQQGLVAADDRRGWALLGRSDSMPPISGGITIMGISIVEQLATQPNPDTCFVILRSRDARNGTVIKLALGDLGVLKLTWWDKDTAASTTASGSIAYAQSRPEPWALRFNRTSFQVDGNALITPDISGSCDLPDTWHIISFGGEADEYYNGNAMNATHAHLAVYDRWLTDDELGRYFSEARFGWRNGEYGDARAQRYLATAQSAAPRALDSSLIEASTDGGSGVLLQRLSEVTEQEGGLMWGDGAGYVRLRTSRRSYQQAPRWTLGDDEANGEIPFQRDVTVPMGPTYLYNQVQVTNTSEFTDRPPGQSSTWSEQTHLAADDASAARYGPRPLDREVSMYWATDAQAYAEWLLALYKAPAARFESVTVDASANPVLWPFVLGVEVGDLVDVVRRPVGGDPVTQQCRVMQVKHHIQAGEGQTAAQVTVSLASAPPPVLTLTDPVTGRLGDRTLGWR